MIKNYHLRCANDNEARAKHRALPQAIKDQAAVCLTFHPSIPAFVVVSIEGPHDAKPLLDLGFVEYVGEQASNDDQDDEEVEEEISDQSEETAGN